MKERLGEANAARNQVNVTMEAAAALRKERTRLEEQRRSERWDFIDDDTCVVIVSRNIHGPIWIEKFRIDNGEVVESFSGATDADKTPEWARPYLDDDL